MGALSSWRLLRRRRAPSFPFDNAAAAAAASRPEGRARWRAGCLWGMEGEEEEEEKPPPPPPLPPSPPPPGSPTYPAIQRVGIAVDETNVLPGALQLIRKLRPQWETGRVKTKFLHLYDEWNMLSPSVYLGTWLQRILFKAGSKVKRRVK